MALRMRLVRRALRHERVFVDRTNPIEAYSNEELYKRCRFDRAGIIFLTDLLNPMLEHPTQRSCAIPTIVQVYTALRFYASGTFQLIDGELCGVSQPSASRIIRKVSLALSLKVNEFVKFPSENIMIDQAKEQFYSIARLPGIVGAVDGTHVRIQSPGPLTEFAFVNRKNQHSINVQGIATADRRFINVVAKWPGSAHDSRIFTESTIGRQLANGIIQNVVLLGDSGYGLTPFLLTPYDQPQTIQQRRFNVAHRKSRVRVENAFGILKRRFSCLHNELRFIPDRCCNIIVACFVLHNIAIDRYGFTGFEENEDIDNIHPVFVNQNVNYRNRLEAGRAFRNFIANTYFN